MVNDKDIAELEKLPAQERMKRLKEMEVQKEKELSELKNLIDKNVRELDSEERKEAPEAEAKKQEEEPEQKTTALEDVVSEEKKPETAAIEYGKPFTQAKVDIGSLYDEVKKFREEMKEVINQGYQLNQREEGEFYQLKKMVEQAEIANSYVKAPKVHTELLNIAEQMLESIQQYKTKKIVREVSY